MTQADNLIRSHASRLLLLRLVVVVATIDAAAPALRSSRPQLKAVSSAIVVLPQLYRSKPQARLSVHVLLLPRAIWSSQLPSNKRDSIDESGGDAQVA